ncbi:MAG: prolyl-tRNA synthetase associated domain-containing protein [Bacteroidales bacterium]|nr:prolyl-tRNA synthetase associated domain-containing protein [Bacteroidales bacterium]MCF8405948.1 prolyl-tRNA synthetase associated domain-containing protein [Bacteroidales bacterium]
MMTEKEKVAAFLEEHGIKFQVYEHPPIPTIEDALRYWNNINSAHCKNLFFRNHKGNRHYLVIFDYKKSLGIHDLEKKLAQGKLSFASEKRLDKYLGLKAGSVSAFGLINDIDNHVYVFIDKSLMENEFISLHPNDNRFTFVIKMPDFKKYLELSSNKYEWLEL